MKKLIHTVFISLIAFNSYADNSVWNINGFIGIQNMKAEDWSASDRQVSNNGNIVRSQTGENDTLASYGVEFDYRRTNWPISLVIGQYGSTDIEEIGDADLHATTFETNVGVRKIWDIDNTSFKPYVSGGISYIGAERERLENNIERADDDYTSGTWVSIGGYWSFNKLNVGFQIKQSQGEVSLFEDNKVEVGGTQASVLLGFHWE